MLAVRRYPRKKNWGIDEEMKTITVFTPTYNRAHTLNNCFQSLKRQSCKDFIWQIIDDGSTDNTASLVEEFAHSADFEIQYRYKENGGKVSAINMSVELTESPLWVCLDSDDYFTDNAIEIILSHYKEIEKDNSVCGLFALRSNVTLEPMQGKTIPDSVGYATQYQIREKHKIPPEYVQVYKTDIVSQYKYPLFEGEKYVPLSYIQDQIDQKYHFLIMREPLMVCEYLPDGITQNHKKNIKNNPRGYIEFRRQQMVLMKEPKARLVACINYDTGNILAHEKNWLRNSPRKVLSVLCYPAAVLNYLLRYRNI